MEWQCLQAGGALLPDLVELYKWLHTNLAHTVTREQAYSITIGRIIALAEKRMDKKYIRNLYDRVKEQYNNYVKLIGGAIGVGACAAVRRGNKIHVIDDGMPILHFLTGKVCMHASFIVQDTHADVEEEDQGNDWLYIVIADIVSTHNQIIEGIYSMIQENKQLPLNRLLPEEPSKISPIEVDISNAIIGGASE